MRTKLRSLAEQIAACKCGGVGDIERCGGCRHDYFGECQIDRKSHDAQWEKFTGYGCDFTCGYFICAACEK